MLRLALSVIGLTLVVLAVSGNADRYGEQQVEEGFQRALVTFGLARALNGVISVVQGTEVAFQPAGVGVNLAPGQILDPVNDLVEDFSWVMLASTTSFGIQRLMLEVLAWPGADVILAVLVVFLLLALWSGAGWLKRRRGWFVRLALFLALLRFLVPALAAVGQGVHHTFLEPRYVAAVEGLEDAADRFGDLSGESGVVAEDDSSIVGRLKRLYSDTEAALNVEQRMQEYKALAAKVVEQTIDLTVIFVFETILLPLLFIAFVGVAYRALVRAWRDVSVH